MKRKWLMLGVFLFATFSHYFAMQSVSPVIPEIMRDFDVSHAEAGLLMFMIALPAIFLSIPVGVLTVKWGPRKVGGSGLFLATVGVLTTYLTPSFTVLAIGRFILGTGGIFVVVSSYSAISHWFSREELGRALGIFTLNMPFATVITLNLLPWVSGSFGWRTCFLIGTVLLLVCSLVYFLLIEDNPLEEQATAMLHGLKNGQAWLVGAVWALFVMATLSYVTWAGTFFIELKNIPTGIAFFMASIVMIVSIPISPVSGFLSDRVGKRKIFLMFSCLGMGFSFLLIPGLSLPVLFLPVATLAVSSAFLPPVLYSLPCEVLSQRMAGVGYGILYTSWSVGVSIGPVLVGYVRDTFTGELPIYAVLAAISFLGLILASLLKTR